jgi:hypothetical protein
MGLLDRLRALLRRPRRDEPVGRHSRVLPLPSVPGAAAALVTTTGTAGVVQADAETAAPSETTAPSETPAPVLAAEPAEPPAPAPGAEPAEPVASSAVTLGFADGGTLALDPDDPRVRTFQAAAQALLEEPRT